MQFEKDAGDDPFNVAELIADVEKGAGSKRYGVQEDERDRKRARIDDDE